MRPPADAAAWPVSPGERTPLRRRRVPARIPGRGHATTLDFGPLRGDVETLAANVLRASAGATVTIWIDDECRVKGTCVDALPALPLHWIVGTYACGAMPADIADDLRHERRERERAWRLD